MDKKGFIQVSGVNNNELASASFIQKINNKKQDTIATKQRMVELYQKDNSQYFLLSTESSEEFYDGQDYLKKAGFSFGNKKNDNDSASYLYQKGSMTIQTALRNEEGVPFYTFLLQKKDLTNVGKIQFAEDLLVFDSHEYLSSFFGKTNVKKDLYYFSDKELKACTVIFGNTSRQAVFVWDDAENMCKLSCVLISDVVPTVGNTKFNGTIYNNEWRLKNGVHSGMNLLELLHLNKKDFEFIGRNSKNEFKIVPGKNGEIDFSKNQIVLGCNNCNEIKLLNTTTVSAMSAMEENLGIYVYYIILFPNEIEKQVITQKN